MRVAKKRWAVVGGGLLGMTTAWRLAQHGQNVTLIEAADHLGGLADAWSLGDIEWDRHYHVSLLSDLNLRELLTEIGLEQEMNWVETKTGFYTDDTLYSMSNTLEFLRFPPLGLIDKLRLGGTIFYASRMKNWKALEQTPVAEWLRKLSGTRTFERVWLPLLRAKLGDNYTKTSAAFIWATIARMYAARRSGLKKEMFGYVPGGYARILKRFEECLHDEGVEVRTSQPLRTVEIHDQRPTLRLGDGTSKEFDRVVLTTPSPVISRTCPALTPDEHSRHQGIQYQGIVCASVLMKKGLSKYYVTNITDDWVPFTAVIEMSALVEPAQLGGNALVYLPKYVDPGDPLFEKPDEDIRAEFLGALERMYPHFSADDVLAFRVSRVRHVVALSTLGYSENLPPMKTSLHGVYAVNSAHIVNGTLNVNETVGLANKVVTELLLPGLSHPLPIDGIENNVEANCQLVAGS